MATSPAPPTSLQPALVALLSLLTSSASLNDPLHSPHSSPPHDGNDASASHNVALEAAALAQGIKAQLAEARKWAEALPGGDVEEEDIEEVLQALNRRNAGLRCVAARRLDSRGNRTPGVERSGRERERARGTGTGRSRAKEPFS
jgi:hypothetical protein